MVDSSMGLPSHIDEYIHQVYKPVWEYQDWDGWYPMTDAVSEDLERRFTEDPTQTYAFSFPDEAEHDVRFMAMWQFDFKHMIQKRLRGGNLKVVCTRSFRRILISRFPDVVGAG
jgi:hypothetical protein